MRSFIANSSNNSLLVILNSETKLVMLARELGKHKFTKILLFFYPSFQKSKELLDILRTKQFKVFTLIGLQETTTPMARFI